MSAPPASPLPQSADKHLRLTAVEMRIPARDSPLFTIPFLEVPQGSRLLIHGPSGAGKTTLLHLLCGQFLPASGSIRLGETDLAQLDADARARLRRRHFGIIFQRGNLIGHLTVMENIRVGIPPGIPDAAERASEALSRMAMTSYANKRAGLLSPGEQQRVAVARIQAASPDIILADEPTSSLDLPGTERVMDALDEISQGRTLVVVSHDPRILSRFETVRDFAKIARIP